MNTNIYEPLDKYETVLRDSIENAKSFKRPKDYKEMLTDATITAYNTTSKSRAISVRLAEKDLLKLKARAEESGIPYQTLISSLLHQYLRGVLDLKV